MPEPPQLPPIAEEPISLILAAHNDEAHLQDVVRAWVRQLQKRDKPFEILVIDDGSTDRTRELAEEVASRRDEVQAHRHLARRGLGGAITTGLNQCQFSLIVTSICDPSYSPEELPKFLAEIDKVHLVSGFRAGRPTPPVLGGLSWTWRMLLRIVLSLRIKPAPGYLGMRNRGIRLLARILFGLRQRDVGCPYRLFRREILPRSPLQSEGEFALVEQLAKINYLTGLFSEDEVPLPIAPSLGKWQSTRKEFFTELGRVLSSPDFGPMLLEEPTEELPEPLG